MIFNPFSSIPVHPRSHVRGWATLWSELLDVQIADKTSNIGEADVLYLDHGVNFGGSMNLFGGVTEEIIDNITELLMSDAKLFSLDIPMPDYAGQLEKRLGQATCHPALAKLLPSLKKRLEQSKTVTMLSFELKDIAMGDSHATAFSPKGSAVLRTNGQTLHGAIEAKVVQSQLDALGYSPERVTLVYGSIDIRHHIGRQADPDKALELLCTNYAKLVHEIEDDYLIEVDVAAPVPVEWEGRKIPQTGFYKGTPFTGTQQQRAEWTAGFMELMSEKGVKVVHAPRDWYAMDGELYAKTYMELGSSVHIAPIYYRRYFEGWKN